MSEIDFMEEAVRLSREGMTGNQGGPFGAVIVHNGKIVGRGCNRVLATCDPTAHAEVNAIRDACANLGTFNLSGSVIYTSCEPCPMCLSAIYWARLDKIFYANGRADAAAIGFDDDLIYQEVALAISQRSKPMVAVPQESALSVFREWSEKRDRVPY